MWTSSEKLGPGSRDLPRPFCRGAELRDITAQLLRDDCRAIFLSSEIGMGTTSLLRALAESPPARAPVISIQGTPSLSEIPFGALAPYLRHATSEFVSSGVDAIREILALLHEKEAVIRAELGDDARVALPLLLIDEADYIDKATAEVVVRLVQAGQVRAVVAHRTTNQLVAPLPKLWNDGLAERIQLQPLTRAEGHKFCVGVLGGRTSEASSWNLWSAGGGNPLLMWLLMADARAHGWVKLQARVWVVEMNFRPPSHELQDVVREQLRGLSAKARQTLNLVALSEPVSSSIIVDILGGEPVRELLERHLVHGSVTGPGQLQLINPIYGEVIRNMVPRGESVMLHRKLMGRVQIDDFNPQALLRRVVWALDNGEQVPDDRVLLAAIYACKLFQSPLALRLAGSVTDDGSALRARCIKARAHYNLGDYQSAAQLLEGITAQAENIGELLFGSLLLSATRSALGQPPELNHRDAKTLRKMGERLALADPAMASVIRMQANERANVLDIMNLSRSGGYRQLGVLAGAAMAVPMRQDDPDFWLNRAVVLAVEAERLSALGKPVGGMEQAAMALAIPQPEDHDVFFLPEMILGRVQTAALCAGVWDQVEHVLGEPDIELGPSVVSFSGSSSVVKGMLLIRQGRVREALDILLSGMDSLQFSDPQQLLGYCTAMGYYAAAVLGENDVAGHLRSQYKEGNGMFVVTTHERAFVTAARSHLNGAVPDELLKLADAAAADGHWLAELNALALALDFSIDLVVPRLRRVAGMVEGPWAHALAVFAAAMEEGTGEAAVSAGEVLMAARLYRIAATSFELGEQRAVHDHRGAVVQSARSGLARATEALGIGATPVVPTDDGRARTPDALTKRELEIAMLAAGGLSDIVIAAKLHVSVRTVEGHLYRSYGKLGITTRSELSRLLPG